MNCAWNELLAILPQDLREETDKLGRESLQELRLREGKTAIFALQKGILESGRIMESKDLRYVLSAASRYSPWSSESISQGYLTAPGGHRIGICGETILEGNEPKGIRTVRSLNIRVARDIPGVADGFHCDGNVLVLGPPGSGKTTFLRDYIRKLSREYKVSVVDERGELFPRDFSTGLHTDILLGCPKRQGIEMLLRTMSPQYIAVDEITAAADCDVLRSALWCGVRILATAHASGIEDLKHRMVYRPLWDSGMFDTFVILRPDQTWYTERREV